MWEGATESTYPENDPCKDPHKDSDKDPDKIDSEDVDKTVFQSDSEDDGQAP